MVAICVLTAFVFILLVDHLVLRIQGKVHPAFEPAIAVINLTESTEINYVLPQNIYLSKGHTWLKNNNDGLIEIGVDQFVASALGGLSITKCLDENSTVKRGDVLFAGNYCTEKVEFLSPVNGTVKKINKKIIGNKITNPYGTWGMKIYSEENIDNKKEFFSGNDAVEWMKTEFHKLKLLLEKHDANMELVGETMFDGGAASGSSNYTPTKIIVNNFKKEFLSL
jgi:glycine cleavage system H lipoate-binding protein